MSDEELAASEPTRASEPPPRVPPRSRPLRHPRPKRSAREGAHARIDRKLDESDKRALRKIFSHKPVHEARYFEEVAQYTRECEEHVNFTVDEPSSFPSPYAIADPSKPLTSGEGAGGGDTHVIDDFLCHLEKVDMAERGVPPRPSTAPSTPAVQAPAPRPYGARSADRLAEQVEDLKSKLAVMYRENRKMKDMLEAKDEKIKKLLDDFDRIRKDPNVMHPTISRLRKLGLNTPALSELNDRWAGYVFGRASMAMEVGNFSYRNVFATHCSNGVLTEDSFKSVIRQFEPDIKSDQLTRLWFFADEDGSGRIDLFEFMRMIGCNSNGEIGDEYYEVLAMHLYRKFHARGGVRRVYATADKNWDQHLDLGEFSKFIKTFLKDVEFTKRETTQVFHRINTSGSGFMSVHELETALEAAGAKCTVSEAWVKETFQALSVAVQDAGLSIKQLWPGSAIMEKEFRDVVLRFLTQLRPAQLDRLWKFLLSACAEDAGPSRLNSEKDRLPSDAVFSAIFGQTLTSSPNETTGSGSSGGVGREVIEQLVQQLVRLAGDTSPDLCFDALNPFITADHFNHLLSSRLGLHFDPVKAKQIFKLIDSDRDGKITRLELGLMFKNVTPEKGRDGSAPHGLHLHGLHDGNADAEHDNEKLQVNRLQNRVLLLQRELEIVRGPGRLGEPMVPEKLFQQLTTAHAKVATQLQVLKEQRKVRERSMGAEVSDGPTISQSGRRLSEDHAISSRELRQFKFQPPEAEVSDTTLGQLQIQLQELSQSNQYLRRRLRWYMEKEKSPLAPTQEVDSSDSSLDDSSELVPVLNLAEEKATQELPLPALEELSGQVHVILDTLQKALQKNPQLRKREVEELLRTYGDVVLEGRWKLKSILAASTRTVVAVCSDIFLCHDVVLKVSQCFEAAQQLARNIYILKRLHAVSIVPEVHYFSSPTSSLPFMVMDLLQGSTLQTRFQDIAEGQAEPMFELEAAELGYSLLTGMDACHQQQVFNLGLCPEHVWVGPDLDGSRIRILDWSHAEVGAASVDNSQVQAIGDMRRKGQLRGNGRPLFYTTSGNVEVQPSEIWACARKRIGKQLQSLTAMSNLSIFGHGSLYYMSMEQLYCAIRSFQKETSTLRPEQTWHQDSVGAVVKVEGQVAHWFQKGDGFIQTSLPVFVTPLGQLFEVEVVRAVNAGQKMDSGLGFCIGLTGRSPRRSRDDSSKGKEDCWIAGGDCAFYLKGVKHPVSKDLREEDATEDRFLRVAGDLKPKDRVGILAEWSGNLSLFLNGERVGRFVSAIDPIEVMAPLYGMADIHVRQASEEYTVRSISLVEESQSSQGDPEQMRRAANELANIHHHLHGEAAVSTTIGPSCDLYACGRILLSCFRGGCEIMPSLNLDRFAVAYADWVRAGCPSTEERYGLLWALKELKNEKTERSEEILQVEKMEVRLLLSRCIKRSRYSRLGSCWEAAEMLAQASCWLGMTEEFLTSHKVAVEQAKRASLLDAHYSVAQELFEQERRQLREDSSARAEAAQQVAETHQVEGSLVSARWNLRAFTIGPPHIRRIIQVLREWPDGKIIQAIGFSRFEANIEPQLQDVFMQCFSDVLQPQHGHKPMQQRRRRGLRHSLGSINVGELRKPLIFLEDVQLPTEELHRTAFPLEEVFERNILWLVVMSACKVDLTPAPSGLGQEKPPSISSVPGALESLISSMERSNILSSLILRSSNLKDGQGQMLSGAVAKCTTLRELDLSDNHLGSKAVAKVLQAGRDNLQILDLSRNRLGDEGARALADALGKGPSSGYSLTVLRLRGNGISDDGGESLAEALMSVTTLLEFDFAENQISVQTAALLFRATCAAKVLKRLNLDSNLPWPTSENCEMLVAAFTDQLCGHQAVPSLELVSLRRCKMHSTGAVKLFHSVASNTTLRKLNVACNGLRQGAAPAIAAALATTGLEVLDLRDNRLGAFDALGLAFQQVFAPEHPHATGDFPLAEETHAPKHRENDNLRSLNLGNNELTGESMVRLSLALPSFTALEELRLYHNPLLGDLGAQALSDLLATPSGTSITHLNLAACGIGDAGCQALMQAVGDYKILKTLDLSCNGLGDDSASSVAEVLSQRDCELEKLMLSMNAMSSYGISELMDGVSRNVDGCLREVDVASQDAGPAKTQFIDEGMSKVKSKFVGLR